MQDYKDEHRAPCNDGAWQKDYLDGKFFDALNFGGGYSVNLVDFFREGIEPYKGCLQDMEYAYDYDNGASRRALAFLYNMLKTPGSSYVPTATVYRVVPNHVAGENDAIHDGDWICLTREYAKMHGDLRYTDDYHILTMRVPASHIYWDGQHLSEFGYDSREFEWNKTSEILKGVSGIIAEAAARCSEAGCPSNEQLEISN